jgi:hypothetical protein
MPQSMLLLGEVNKFKYVVDGFIQPGGTTGIH